MNIESRLTKLEQQERERVFALADHYHEAFIALCRWLLQNGVTREQFDTATHDMQLWDEILSASSVPGELLDEYTTADRELTPFVNSPAFAEWLDAPKNVTLGDAAVAPVLDLAGERMTFKALDDGYFKSPDTPVQDLETSTRQYREWVNATPVEDERRYSLDELLDCDRRGAQVYVVRHDEGAWRCWGVHDERRRLAKAEAVPAMA